MNEFSGRKEISLGAAIKAALKDNGIDKRMDETHLLEKLDQILGAHIARHITSKRISNSVLYIHLDSAALRHELGYRRDELKIALNKSVDSVVIKEIVFS